MRYLLDIDGTVLTQCAPGDYDEAKPLDGAKEKINAAYDAGHQIVFYTSRNFKYMRQTYKQLRDFGFRFHHISFNKPHADRIIDDRAEAFTTWEEIDL
jgi:hydroxymethylpyrimidine pyrophosphatase-like HAD family hydrolase